MSSVLYDSIGNHYDETRRADPYIATKLLEHLKLEQNQLYLDIACGTGNYTSVLSRTEAKWIGIDRSGKMLAQARSKTSQVLWCCTDVQSLPFATDTFAGALCVLAIHHFPSLEAAFKEAFRVIRPGGRLVLFTSTREQMRHYWLSAYFPAIMERAIQQMPALSTIKHALQKAGFKSFEVEPYEVKDGLQDLFLYCGKNKPELYLDPRIRQGISSFASLTTPAEMREGLEKLLSDLNSNRISKVQAFYSSSGGDYCFITTMK